MCLNSKLETNRESQGPLRVRLKEIDRENRCVSFFEPFLKPIGRANSTRGQPTFVQGLVDGGGGGGSSGGGFPN